MIESSFSEDVCDLVRLDNPRPIGGHGYHAAESRRPSGQRIRGRDIMREPASEMSGIAIDMTLVDAKIAFERGGRP